MSTAGAAAPSDFDDLTQQAAETRYRIMEERKSLLKQLDAYHNVVSELLFHARILLRTRKLMNRMDNLHSRISDADDMVAEHKDKAREVASDLGVMASELYDLANTVRGYAEEQYRKSPRWYRRMYRRLCFSKAEWFERLACSTEDAAETLALGSSDSFTVLVQKQLHAES